MTRTKHYTQSLRKEIEQSLEDERLLREEIEKRVEEEAKWYREYMEELAEAEIRRWEEEELGFGGEFDAPSPFYDDAYDYTEGDYMQMAFPLDYAMCRGDMLATGVY